MMRTALSVFFMTLFLATGQPKANQQTQLVSLQALGLGTASNTVAVAPISTLDPLDGLRATVNYFENLADSASTPLLVFLPTQSGSTWHDGNREDALRHLQDASSDVKPRWIVFADINKCEASDHAKKAYWRQAGWVWSGPTQQFCVPEASVTLTATMIVVEVSSGEVVASSEIDVTGERRGPMVQLQAPYEAFPCASSPALHAKAKGQALREMGAHLAYEVDKLLSTVMFQQ